MRRSLLLTLFGLALHGAGCAQHTLEPGLWKLRFDAIESRTRESLQFDPIAVRLASEWASDAGDAKTPTDGEIVELTPLYRVTEGERQSLEGMTPLYGFIAAGGDSIRFEPQKDATWAIEMEGVVQSPIKVLGRKFVARVRLPDVTEPITIQGLWWLDWVSSE